MTPLVPERTLINARESLAYKNFSGLITELHCHSLTHFLKSFNDLRKNEGILEPAYSVDRMEAYFIKQILKEIQSLRVKHRVRWYNVPYTRRNLNNYQVALTYLENILVNRLCVLCKDNSTPPLHR